MTLRKALESCRSNVDQYTTPHTVLDVIALRARLKQINKIVEAVLKPKKAKKKARRKTPKEDPYLKGLINRGRPEASDLE